MAIKHFVPACGKWVLYKRRPNTSSIEYQVAFWGIDEWGIATPFIASDGDPYQAPSDWDYHLFRHP